MHREGFLLAGFYLVVSAAVLAAASGVALVGAELLRPFELFTSYHPLAQLALWELLVLNVAFWLVGLLSGRHWPFDSLGWPTSPVYAALFFWNTAGNTQRQELALVLSCLYCIRLNGNYFRAEGFGFPEDWRYLDIQRQLQARGIGWAIPSFFLVYVSQWLMIFGATAPIYYIMTDASSFQLHDIACSGIVLSGILLEFFADSQLQDFVLKKKSSGDIINSGLWRFSRHPNYLGQCVFWAGLGVWGLFSGCGWLVFVGSCNISALILFYSIDAMEQRMLANPFRKKAYEEFQRTTSKLLLLPRRH